MTETHTRSSPRPILKKYNSKPSPDLRTRPKFFTGSLDSSESDDSDEDLVRRSRSVQFTHNFHRFDSEILKNLVIQTANFIEKNCKQIDFIYKVKQFLTKKSQLASVCFENNIYFSSPDLRYVNEATRNDLKHRKNLVLVKKHCHREPYDLHETLSCSLPVSGHGTLDRFNVIFNKINRKTSINKSFMSNELNFYEAHSKTKKIVRFADSLGLDLARIKIIKSDEFADIFLVESPKKVAFVQPSSQEQSSTTKKEHFLLIPKFTLDKTPELNIQLHDFTFDYECKLIKCVARVRNFSYEKRVFARVTFDAWKTHVDIDAIFDESKENYDYFTYFILVPSKQKITSDTLAIEFALCLECGSTIQWDNNFSSNYIFQCYYS